MNSCLQVRYFYVSFLNLGTLEVDPGSLIISVDYVWMLVYFISVGFVSCSTYIVISVMFIFR